MKKRRISGVILLLICLVVVFSSPVGVSAAKLNKKTISISAGKSYKLKVTGAKGKITWSSGNANVASVSSSGKVKGVKKGKCNIYAKVGKKQYTCKVTVKQPVTDLTLNKKSIKLNLKNSYALKVTVSPANANNKGITWKSSNKKVATVSAKGKITAKKVGTATITAIAKDGSKKKATCKVTVTKKCLHNDTITLYDYEPTCYYEGYTGDVYCEYCWKLLSEGKDIPQLEHELYVSGYEAATFTEEGYTGDTYCRKCGDFIKEGAVIPVRTDYRTVTLSLDNWAQYFTFSDTTPIIYRNSFGEIESVSIEQYLAIKPVYKNKIIAELCSGAIEVSGVYTDYSCEWDASSQTVTLLAADSNTSSKNTWTTSLQEWGLSWTSDGRLIDTDNWANPLPAYYINCSTLYTSDSPTKLYSYLSDITVTRIQGTLYFEP